MNKQINIYNTLLNVIKQYNNCLFYINNGLATIEHIDEEKKEIKFFHEVMQFNINITFALSGIIQEDDLIEWEDQGEYFDIRVVIPIKIK